MTPKRPATLKESDSKRSRKLVTIEKKLEVLDRYDRGEKSSVIVHATGLSDSTLRTIRANADKIRASSIAGTSASSSQCSRARSIEMERMEKLLAQWIQHQNKDNVPISMAIIQTKALSIYKDLLLEDEEDKAKKFNASSGWFARFKKRYGYDNVLRANKESQDKAREAGFDDLEQKDIDELLESHREELTNEKLLEMEKIQNAELEASRPTPETPEPERVLTKSDLEKALASIRDGLDVLEAKDPNINRSATVARKVMSELNCYKLMLEQKKKKNADKTPFFSKEGRAGRAREVGREREAMRKHVVSPRQAEYNSETPHAHSPTTHPCSLEGSRPSTSSASEETQSSAEGMDTIQGGINDSLAELAENQKLIVTALSELVADQKQMVASQEEMVAVVRDGVNAIQGALELYKKHRK
ncbi:uncharacterized protein LOC134785576 [Penaeus indicus]|uniref:uncharacterized protein LOC134785576 n=1 Tax=Penaeus indicus TaxID=29960 RepID=UPI00300D30D9